MSDWTTLLPPLIAIFLALITRKVIPSLFVAIISGIIISNGFSWSFTSTFLDKYLIDTLADKSHIYVILFTMFIGGMVNILHKNGSMLAVVQQLAKWVNSSKRAQLFTFFSGMIVFFDDYANSLIIGSSMRPLTDKFKVSREKLAYIVDSTAAPIASVAFVTTWIGAEIGYISDAIAPTSIEVKPYTIFLNSLPYSFYPFFTLLFVFLIAFLERDFGPMLKAEKKALLATHQKQTSEKTNGNIWLAIVPTLSLIGITFFGLIATGKNSEAQSIGEIIGNADAYSALLWGSFSSLLIATTLQSIYSKNIETAITESIDGFKQMIDILIILVLAWILASIISDLNTADYLSSLLGNNIPLPIIAAIVFILAALTSFATGSSWGTMAILYPLAIPVVWNIITNSDIDINTAHKIIYMTVASVLGGAVFGDHCSPISDTTILSSAATNCDHIQHVKTQIPYAITVGGISILALLLTSFLGVAIAGITGTALTYIIVRYYGQPKT